MADKNNPTLKNEISVQDTIHLAEEMVNSLIATIRKQQMYPEHHATIKATTSRLHGLVQEIHRLKGSFVIGIVDGEIIFEDVPLKRLGESINDTLKTLNEFNVDSLSFEEGVSYDALSRFTTFISNIDKVPKDTMNLSGILKQYGISNISFGKGGNKASASSINNNQHNDSEKAFESTQTFLYSIFESIRSKGGIDIDKTNALSENIINTIEGEKDTLKILSSLKHSDNHTFTHSLNVSILNVLQGKYLSFDKALLKAAATAGLLHDIGKRSVPEVILNKKDSLTEEEKKIVRSHPVEGAKMLLAMSDVDSLVPIVAYEHHQRYDLKGYPAVRGKKKLNPLSNITAISDAYDNLRNPLSIRKEVFCYQAMAFLKKDSGTVFDPFLFECFEKLIGYYPPGTCVELETGEIAVVIKSCREDETRPQIRIVKNTASSPPLRGETFKLTEKDSYNRYITSINKVVPSSEIDFDIGFYMED